VTRTVAVCLLLAACAQGPGSTSQPIVYGTDDRRELFEVDRAEVRARVEASVVALIPRKLLRRNGGAMEVLAQSWGEVDGLCTAERFRDQPAAAFCTGVLVDDDLVLTAGHCTRAYGLADFVVVFGYSYAQPGVLAVRADDVYDVAEIPAEALAPVDVRPRIGYAWLRLARPAHPPRAPAPLRLAPPAQGAPLLFVGAGGGIPLKTDAGGTVTDPGLPELDYFVASTDSFHGASGGAAFDDQLALLGTLERGGQDTVTTAQGCQSTLVASIASAQEEFTFVARSREALCAASPASSLCRADCGDPCRALPPAASGGCRVSAHARGSGSWALLVVLLLALARLRSRDARWRARREL
jgi:hypothetical protein